MPNIFITGVSSGIGRSLAKKLAAEGHRVFGVARRKQLLESLKREISSAQLSYLCIDLENKSAWEKIGSELTKRKFKPDVVLFNAAFSRNDLELHLNLKETGKTFEINFFSILRGVDFFLKEQKKCHFIVISSLSALKGNGAEGVGYSASKAAVSLAFESLHQKFKNSNFYFTTIYLGPVRGGMSPFKAFTPNLLSQDKIIDYVKKAMEEKGPAYYYPWNLFFFFRFIRILPVSWTFKVLSWMEKIHMLYSA